MISLTSRPTAEATEVLRGFEARRQARVVAGLPLTDSLKSGHRHLHAKDALRAETHDKCAYCEAKVTAVYFGDVEHIKPVDTFPELRFDYDNLTFACAKCNNGKGAYFIANAPIVNPYETDPSDDLIPLGNLVWHKNGSDSGRRTIRLLNLNRPELMQRRKERLESISALADSYLAEPPGPIKDSYYEQLHEEAADAGEYAMYVRDFLLRSYGIRAP